MPCDCIFGGSGGNRREVGLTEGGVMVVWPVCWVFKAKQLKFVMGNAVLLVKLEPEGVCSGYSVEILQPE